MKQALYFFYLYCSATLLLAEPPSTTGPISFASQDDYSYPNCLLKIQSASRILIERKVDLVALSHTLSHNPSSSNEIVFRSFLTSYRSLLHAQQTLTADQLDLKNTGCSIDGVNHNAVKEKINQAQQLLKKFNLSIENLPENVKKGSP